MVCSALVCPVLRSTSETQCAADYARCVCCYTACVGRLQYNWQSLSELLYISPSVTAVLEVLHWYGDFYHYCSLLLLVDSTAALLVIHRFGHLNLKNWDTGRTKDNHLPYWSIRIRLWSFDGPGPLIGNSQTIVGRLIMKNITVIKWHFDDTVTH